MNWPAVAVGSEFPLANLPYGIAVPVGQTNPRPVVAIGSHAVCLATLAAAGLLDGTTPDPAADFTADTLNPFMSRGRKTWQAVRVRLTELLTDPGVADRLSPALVPRSELALRLPFAVGDYVDFYSSLEHATNLGRLFRPDADPLLPNWRELPVGYHGRAGTVVVSGTPVVRPCGQRKAPTDARPTFGPTRRLDIEAELGFVVGVPSVLGSPVRTADFAEHVFGVVVVNDWSARDLQAWEYQPLGPFLGKSFATSVSPWVVTLDALEAARVAAPVQEPVPLDYLRVDADWGLDIELTVALNGSVVSRPPFAGMYWTMPQQLAHATVNGAALRTGDLFASGTVSGPQSSQRGSFIELSWGGREPLELPDGSTRTFLEDGDTVTITASAPTTGGRLGFGPLAGTVTPARSARA